MLGSQGREGGLGFRVSWGFRAEGLFSSCAASAGPCPLFSLSQPSLTDRVLGFRVLGFRVLGFRVLGFWLPQRRRSMRAECQRTISALLGSAPRTPKT